MADDASAEPWGRAEAGMEIGEPGHCVVTAEASGGVPGSGPALRPPVHPPHCFKMFSEALSFATQGQVVLPEGTAPDDVEAALDAWERSTGSGERSTHPHVIAIEYTDKGYRGASLTVQSELSCDTSVLSLNLTGAWNKVISSARVSGGCRHAYHYEDIGLRGTRADCDKHCPFLGDALNERTSSILWTR